MNGELTNNNGGMDNWNTLWLFNIAMETMAHTVLDDKSYDIYCS